MSPEMAMLLQEYVFALGLMLLFGLCGAGALAPFMARLRYGILATPLAGLLLAPLGTIAFYVVLHISFGGSVIAAIGCCLLLTVVQYKVLARETLHLAFSAIVASVTVAILVVTVDAATITANGLAFTYGDGTDHGGYAHIADWLLAHQIQLPAALPELPYQSWPALMFTTDPRFGSFSLLAIVAWFHGTSGVFAYDIACTIILACSTLGVAAVFARNAGLYTLLVAGLLTSQWFEYGRCGFFGKLISYPSALFLAGLVFSSFRELSAERLFFLIFLTTGAAIMHSGAGLAVLLVGIYAGALVLSLFSFRKSLRDFALLAGITTLLPTIASGVLARPLATGFPDWHVSWPYALPRILDLDNQGTYVTGLTPGMVEFLVAVSFLLWAAFLIWAVRVRDIPALGMIGGPAIVLAALAADNSTGPAFQMMGYFYPAFLCGAICLVKDASPRAIGLMAMIVVAIGVRQPRFVGDIERYVTIGDSPSRYTKAETDRLAADIGSNVVEIDVPEPQAGIVLLDELGRRSLHLAWSAQGWKTVFGYRDWSPVPPTGATRKLTLLPHPTMNSHYLLTDVENIPAPN